jgi:hypothetical protein
MSGSRSICVETEDFVIRPSNKDRRWIVKRGLAAEAPLMEVMPAGMRRRARNDDRVAFAAGAWWEIESGRCRHRSMNSHGASCCSKIWGADSTCACAANKGGL